MDPHQAGKPLIPHLAPSGSSLPSRLGLGTHALHRLLSGRARQRLLRLAHDLGVRHFDTAPSYGAGLAEREIGRFCRGHRAELVLTTKFGIAPSRLAALLPAGAYLHSAAGAALRTLRLRRAGPAHPARDYSPEAMRESVESLRAAAAGHPAGYHPPVDPGCGPFAPGRRILRTAGITGRSQLSGGSHPDSHITDTMVASPMAKRAGEPRGIT